MPLPSAPITGHRRRRSALAALITTLMMLAILITGTAPARAATPDYTLEISAPQTVPVGKAFRYTVSILTPTANASSPATGINLAIALPAGVKFDAVPFGGTNIVATAPAYDEGTNTVHLSLRDITEGLNEVVFTVTQVNTAVMDPTTTFIAHVTGTPSDTGTAPTASVLTRVVGNLNYSPTKNFATILGGSNRIVEYTFDVATRDSGPEGGTFTTWGQRLTDVLPSGAVITNTFTSIGGTWTVSGTPATGLRAVWERTGTAYGPSTAPMAGAGAQLGFTVSYPEATFPDGTRPPENVVGLEVSDHGGTWSTRPTAKTQGPAFIPSTIGHAVAIEKTANFSGGQDSFEWGNGQWLAQYGVRASFLNSVDTEQLDTMTIEDSAGIGADNAAFFEQGDLRRLAVLFNATLRAADVPYRLEYTTSGGPAWHGAGSGLRTGTDLRMSFVADGSTGWDSDGYTQVEKLPAGQTVTGWRIVLSPEATDPGIPGGSQAQVAPSYVPSLAGAAGATETYTNTAVVNGVMSGGVVLPGAADSARLGLADRVPVITQVIGVPSTLTVGQDASYLVNIANMDPVRAYADAKMRVVLPVGVFYDDAVGVSPAYAQTPTANVPVPVPGSGLTISTETVTEADGEHQVVVFAFDTLASIRLAGTPQERAETQGFRYTIPVRVLPQAYAADQGSVTTRSFASVDDPAFASVPMGFSPAYVGDDTFNFNPALPSIARFAKDSQVATSGGLLMGKQVRAHDTDAWALSAPVSGSDPAQWKVYVRNVLSDAVTNLVVFDRMPTRGDERGSAFGERLVGPLSGAPAGAVIEYSNDATSATTGTWSADPADAAGATAFRLTTGELNSGEEFELRFDTTADDPGARSGARAINDVSATASYRGSPRSISSNEADIVMAPAPALSVLKKTNGVEYSTAPGATVTSGSEVTWSYLVTNTGNTPLANIEVVDAYTDGQGGSGTQSVASGPGEVLEPGASRTFELTSIAVEGQYHNVATVSAAAVDETGTVITAPVAPASDESWYLGTAVTDPGTPGGGDEGTSGDSGTPGGGDSNTSGPGHTGSDADSGGLASTGSDAAPLLAGVVLLLLAGGGLMLMRRRARQGRSVR
ncbi:DUF7507 domain-containing protein [Mycetocola lacteus]|uniref:DUF7507 domain-containing protein n=1 Tax=Mycetocola lacteus TaxID=76637 RepID=UPI0011C44741|nr:hypothetical protein [Mycetocola lacteus]